MSVTLREHQKRAEKRDSHFLNMIMVSENCTKKVAKRYLETYKRKKSPAQRQRIREEVTNRFQAIKYGDSKNIYREKIRFKDAGIITQNTWFDDWKIQKGIVTTRDGSYNRPLSAYEKRIVSGHERYPYATLMDLRGH